MALGCSSLNLLIPLKDLIPLELTFDRCGKGRSLWRHYYCLQDALLADTHHKLSACDKFVDVCKSISYIFNLILSISLVKSVSKAR